MAAPFLSTPFQPYVYQSPQNAVVPFQILGGETQIVQIMLKPQEKVLTRPGSMCYTSGSVQMDNVYVNEREAGLWQWVFGKSISSTFLLNFGSSDGFVGIAAPFMARVLPIDLAMFGGELLCQPDAFLCSLSDVKVSNTVNDQRVRNAVPRTEDFLRQRLSGGGLVFIVGGGSVVQKNLEVGEVLSVNASCIVALMTTINVELKFNGPTRSMFGVGNQVAAILKGPGIVFIQSLPLHRFSQRIAGAAAAPNIRENPKLFILLAISFFLAYVVIVSSMFLLDA